jgi:hypothetical protein
VSAAPKNGVKSSNDSNMTRPPSLTAKLAAVVLLASFAAQAATNPPTIVAQPQSVSQINGFPAWFTVGATGAPPLAYQWRRSGTNLAGATNIAYG